MKTHIVPHSTDCQHDTAIVEGDTIVVCAEPLSFGAYMRVWREGRGLTAKSVAQAIGVSPQYLADIELERRLPPDRATVMRWADAVGADLWVSSVKALVERAGDYRPIIDSLVKDDTEMASLYRIANASLETAEEQLQRFGQYIFDRGLVKDFAAYKMPVAAEDAR